MTIYNAPKGKSKRYGLPGLDKAAKRDHQLSLLYSQYDTLHKGIVLYLLQSGCPSDGYQYTPAEERLHALACAMHLALFPNLKVVRCCTVTGFRHLLPVLCDRRLSVGLVRNFLGHQCSFSVEGTALEVAFSTSVSCSPCSLPS